MWAVENIYNHVKIAITTITSACFAHKYECDHVGLKTATLSTFLLLFVIQEPNQKMIENTKKAEIF